MNKTMNLFLIFTLFILPVISSAQVIFTEIMYDLEGSDTDREWIEITNTGSGSIDLSNWKFFENTTNHGLTLYQGDASLSANDSAIIVGDPLKFLSDWPNFNGAIFDSSFSLSNSGETLIIRDENLADIDSVSYLSDWGANGDGNSLRLVSGSWVAGAPSPGVYNSGQSQNTNQTNTQSSTSTNTNTSGGGAFGKTTTFPVGEIKTKIIAPDVVLSGAGVYFEAESFGVDGKKLENARHLWNFGDGSVREGEGVLYNYIYPGHYLIFLDVNSEDFTADDKHYIEVITSPLTISEASSDLIKIDNSSSEEINISLWILQAGENFFHVPKNTHIRSGGEIIFPREITGLNGALGPVKLLYPNGNTAHEYEAGGAPEMSTLGVDISGAKNSSVARTFEASVVLNNQSRQNRVETNISEAQIASAVLAQENVPPENSSQEEFSGDDSEGNKNTFFNKWFLGVLGIILISVLALVFINKDNKVEGFTIIE